MKLNHPRTHRLRVHELAAELGWTSRQLLFELSRRGEFVKSASSTLEAPIVRAIRRDFAPGPSKPELDESCTRPGGRPMAATAAEDPDEPFEEAVRRAKSRSNPPSFGSRQSKWTPPVLHALLEQVVARHGLEPTTRDHKEARRLHREWAAACLRGLDDAESTMIKWIRISGGYSPIVAAELSDAGLAPEEASLRLGYDGREAARWPTLFERYRDGKINRSEAMAAARRWREKHKAG
jgi:Translation initiation factor IF-2, N-terminal region